MLKIGSHISFKAPNYLVDSIKESLANEANSLMIYLGPPQSTKRIDVNKFNIEEYKSNYANIINPMDIVVHAPYIVNLANLKKSDFAIEFLINEINKMNLIGAKYLVLHPGSSLKQDINKSIKHLAKNLDEILKNTKEVIITLETMAGKGSELGVSLEQLKLLIDLCQYKERLGICLDTCHMWDAGYNLKTDFENNNGSFLFNKLEQLDLLKKVRVIHLNDSKNELNSHKDRHENIGKGFIGKKALINFANHKNFKNIPIILETPYVDGKNFYKEEIEMIKKGK